MTDKEKVLKVWPKDICESRGFGWFVVGYWHENIFLRHGEGPTDQAAWQNAAESLPAAPELECDLCGQPKNDGGTHKKRQGYGDFESIECSWPDKSPIPPASTNSPAIPAKEEEMELIYIDPRTKEPCRRCDGKGTMPPWPGSKGSVACGVCRAEERPNQVDKPTKEREQEVVAVRANDKPPIHWKENDGWKRHPQTAEEWNWHDDHVGGGDRRSELRINFAVDRSDPHAPDQMAQVLRIDLMRIISRMHSAEAYKRLHLSKQLSHPSDQPTQKEAQGFDDFWIKVCTGEITIPNVSEQESRARSIWNAALSHKEKL